MLLADSFVYCWTNLTTGMLYIGSHKGTLADGYVSSSNYLKEDYLKDPTNFSRQVIAVGDWTTMRKFEDTLIRKMWADNISCYNKATGGLFKMDDDIRAKISLSLKGKPKSDQAKVNYAVANKKKARDPAIIAKLKKPKPEGHGAAVSAALKGVPKTAEHRAKLSAAKTGENHKNFGKTYEELYGVEKAVAMKERMASVMTGKTLITKGKTYEEIYGVEAAQRLKEKRSVRAKLTVANWKEITCPHCGVVSKSPANMARWHFDKCKGKL